MYISYLHQRIVAVLGTRDFRMCFQLPPGYSKAIEQSFREASAIAEIDKATVHVFDSSDCLVATFGR
jgi:hypothetical protein